ncbi:MAG: DUF4350 domain-containing protein [Burkholderiales bacterium]|nr:DUF4350 domain-containing protein [Burkholderiales bacterium]
MTRPSPGGIAAAVLVVLAMGWWFSNFELVREATHVGLRGEARSDPFLAARTLLGERGVAIDTARAGTTRFDTLVPRGTLLIAERRHLSMPPTRVATLKAWVEGGGHIIIVPEPPSRPDALLDAFGISRPAVAKPASGAKPRPGASAPARPSSAPALLRLPGLDRPLAVDPGPGPLLAGTRGPPLWQIADANGMRAVSLTAGAGRVTAMTSLEWAMFRGNKSFGANLQPPHIGMHDHAELLVRLTQGGGPVRFVIAGDDASLWSWLASNAHAPLIALALLVTLWLWRAIPRLGPLQPDPPRARPTLAAHFAASGRLMWKHSTPAQVHALLRAGFLRRLATRRPGLARASAAERNAALASLAGVAPAALARALDLPAHSAGEVVANVALLARLSQRL